jgi:hypothetical protein
VNISSDGANVWYNWNGTNITYTAPINITFAEGSNTLSAWANDSLGNLNTTSITFSVNLLAPSLEIITPVNTVYSNATQLVNISSDGANVWYNWNGTNITYTIPINITFAEGSNTLHAWANDGGSNFNYISVSFTVDTINPSLEIIAPVNTTYTNATQLVNISATDDNLDNVWYNWNGTNYSYTAPVNIIFAEGTNTLHAWANDSSNHVNYTSIAFTVDTVAPSLEIISPVNVSYNTTNHLVNISSNGENVWYNWNGINITYTAPINITFAEGSNTLDAWANDSAGNTNYSSITFTVDTIAPSLEIISPVNTVYSNATQLVNISSDGANVWYNWNGTNITYTAPINITFAEGSNTLSAWANDSLGNLNTTSITFSVNLLAPSLEIITPVNTVYSNATQLVNISSDGANVWYNWNGTNITYTIPINITFAEGSNTLHAWANDGGSNFNYISVSFTVDTINPSLEIIAPVNTTYTNATQLVNISATDDNLDNVWYNWNGTNYSYTAPVNIIFAEGTNTLHAWANDSSNHVNYTSIAFTVDTSAILLEIITPQNSSYNNATQLVNISSDGANVWYNYNGTNITYTAPINITFAEGTNTLQAWANDSSNHTNHASVAFTVDTIAPIITINSPLNTTYYSMIILANISSSENLSSILVLLNGIPQAAGLNPANITAVSGLNNLTVYANDYASNFNASEVFFTVDLSNCTSSWVCSAWSQSSCGTRTCTDINGCAASRVETLTCPTTPPEPGTPGTPSGPSGPSGIESSLTSFNVSMKTIYCSYESIIPLIISNNTALSGVNISIYKNNRLVSSKINPASFSLGIGKYNANFTKENYTSKDYNFSVINCDIEISIERTTNVSFCQSTNVSVKVTNTQTKLNNASLVINSTTGDIMITNLSLLPYETKEFNFSFVPVKYETINATVMVNNQSLSMSSLGIEYIIPEFSICPTQNNNSLKIFIAINKTLSDAEIEFNINKGKETSQMEFIGIGEVYEPAIFEYDLKLASGIAQGDYEIYTKLFDSGAQVSDYSSTIYLNETQKGLPDSVKITLIISGFVIFIFAFKLFTKQK